MGVEGSISMANKYIGRTALYTRVWTCEFTECFLQYTPGMPVPSAVRLIRRLGIKYHESLGFEVETAFG